MSQELLTSTIPPAAPGAGATSWHCRCGNLLGIVYCGWLYSRHRGRAVEATLPARVQCEACGRKQVRLPDVVTEKIDRSD